MLHLLTVTGCATIAHGIRQAVTVTSNPTAAAVTLLSMASDGRETVQLALGVTPVTLHVARREAHLVMRVEKERCPTAEMPLKRRVSGWVAGNLVFANPLAMQGYSSNPGGQYARR